MSLVHTAEEAAAIIGGDCKASWLREKARRREIPFTMIGGSYRWTDEHLKEIVRLGEEQPSPPVIRRAPPRPGTPRVPGASVPLLQAREPRRRKPAA
jgi:hypothetical protein